MKKLYMIGILVVALALLVVGCSPAAPEAEPQPTPEAEAPAPAAAPEPAAPTAGTTETTEVSAPRISGDVSILGKEGFSPAEFSASAGSTVVFVNNDPAERNAVLTFKRMDAQQFVTSPQIRAGEAWEGSFEAGEYEFWAVGYGVKSMMTVE